MKGLQTYLKGSVTIEYTLLLPILLLVYTFLIMLALFQYNRCLLTTNVYLIGNQGIALVREDAEVKNRMLKEKEARLYYEKYILVEDLQTTYSIKGNHIEIIGTGNMINPLQAVGIGVEKWKLSARCKKEVIDPVSMLGIYKNVRDQIQQRIPKEE